MKRGAIMVFSIMICCGCGSDKPRTVLVETDGANAAPASTGLDDIVRRDALLALKILDEALKGDDADLAGWAAVHILRLGVKHDADAVKTTLARCVYRADPMLAGLCWRWFATGNYGDVPGWKKRARSEPIPAVMAAVALARGGKIPTPLADALGLSEEPAGGSKKERQEDREAATLALIAPYDNGPLALAVSFVESRRNGWVDEDGTQSAVRLRTRLLDALATEDVEVARAIENSKPFANPPSTSIRYPPLMPGRIIALAPIMPAMNINVRLSDAAVLSTPSDWIDATAAMTTNPTIAPIQTPTVARSIILQTTGTPPRVNPMNRLYITHW